MNYRDVLHFHVMHKHCPVCAGHGKIGRYRWMNRNGKIVETPTEKCPCCNGTGKKQSTGEKYVR